MGRVGGEREVGKKGKGEQVVSREGGEVSGKEKRGRWGV